MTKKGEMVTAASRHDRGEKKKENDGNRERMAQKRANMTEEEKKKENDEDRERMAQKRANMTEGEKKKENDEERERMAQKRANMTEGEKKKENDEDRERMAQKRANMTEGEKKKENDGNCKRNAKKREEVREEKGFDGWSITADELKAKLSEFKNPDDLFANLQRDPSVAVMLYYLNSGLFRFHQYKEYDPQFDGVPIDEEDLIEEIRKEMLTDGELKHILEEFYTNHSYTKGNLYSCGGCGFRILDRQKKPLIQYNILELANYEAKFLKYNEEDMKKYHERQRCPPIEVLASANGDMMEVSIGDLYSCYRSEKHGVFHLHPELIETKEDGTEFTRICPTCWSKVKANKVPPLSIANGVDFGNYRRANLEMPNLHETVILSLSLLIFATVKISSNTTGHVNFTRDKLRFNAILFAHDALEVAVEILDAKDIFTVEHLKETLKVYLLSPDGKFDELANCAFGRHELLARPWVLHQWIPILKEVNPKYKSVPIPSYMELHRNVTEANKYIQENATRIGNKKALRFEKGLGSDVAKAQSTEAECDPEFDAQSEITQCLPVNSEEGSWVKEGNMESSTPMQYSYVTTKPSTCLDDKSVLRSACLRSMGRLVELNKNSEEEGSSSSTAKIGDAGRNIQAPLEYVSDDNFSDVDSEYADYRFGEAVKGSHRSDEPLNEFQDKDDFILATSFPHIFLFGKAYGRPVGWLSEGQRNHLLHQFTLIPSRDRRLLGYMFDTLKRFQVVTGVNAYVENKKDSVKFVQTLLTDEREQEALQKAIKNPNTQESIKMINKYYGHVKFVGKDISYGFMESSKLKSQVSEQCKRYGAANSFITLSFADMDNPRSLRASSYTIDNTKFPAVYDGEDFMNRLRNASTLVSEGSIDLPEGEYNRSGRAKAAMDNPVSYVTESKAMINDFCSLLLGIPPEGFFAMTDSQSRRRTRYYKTRKGILGHALAYIGVVEDHAKGTLHYHLLFFGGLSPYLLQRFAGMKNICGAISEVLDTMYKSTLPSRVHLGVLVRKLAHDRREWGLAPKALAPLSSEPLLSRMKAPQEVIQDGEAIWDNVVCHTCNQGGRQQLHTHMETCHHGFLGQTGCRFCMPFGQCCRTMPVFLMEPIDEKHQDGDLEEDYAETDSDQDSSDDEEEILFERYEDDSDDVHGREEDPNVEKEDENHPLDYDDLFCERREETDQKMRFPFRVIEEIPSDSAQTTHRLCDVLSRKRDSSVVVWETARPQAESLLPSRFSKGDETCTVMMNRKDVMESLQRELLTIPSYNEDSKLWPWLTQLDDIRLFSIYDELVRGLEEANGYVASYNPTTSYCTGSHNNFSLLGSLEQAKGAIFYVCPYMGKSKYPLQQCLTLLQQTLNHIEKYPSTATDSGTEKRTARHFLQRLLNKMNLHMELSDHQMVAGLIGLPSIICSDQFAYGNPVTDMAYQTHVQMRKDASRALEELMDKVNSERDRIEHYKAVSSGGELSDFIVCDEEEEEESEEEECQQINSDPENDKDQNDECSDTCYYTPDILEEIGYLKVFSFKEEKPDGTVKTFKTLVPSAAFYSNRGEGLKQLSRHEYRALVFVRTKRNNVTRVTEFDFADRFTPASQHTQILQGKQRTPILTRKPPRHPGREPSDALPELAKADWQEKANEYARYFLSEYRPETDCYLAQHKNTYRYDWQALNDWIRQMQIDPCIISHFRLMAMHIRMQGFSTKFRTKVMVNKYRGRNRYYWTDTDKRQFQWNNYLRQKEEEHDRNVLDEYEFSQQHATLATRTNNQMKFHIADDEQQLASYASTWTGNGSGFKRKIGPSVMWEKQTPKEIQNVGVQLRRATLDQGKASQDENTKSSSEKLNVPLWIQQHAQKLKLNKEQREFYHLCCTYLQDPALETNRLPPITLLHGAAGTGKSTVTHGVIDVANQLGKKTVRTAFNSINALAIGGDTTASIIKLNVKVQTHRFEEPSLHALQDLQRLLTGVSMLIVDEVSNQAPFHLAQLSHVCQRGLNNFDQPFGGLPVLLVGDLNQLGPVKAGLSLTRAVMEVCGHKIR